MKQFNYVINDPLGLHARPAGLLAKLAKPYVETTITITKGEKSVKASQLMKIMSLAAKNGDEVTVTVEGPEEDAAFEAVKSFFEANL